MSNTAKILHCPFCGGSAEIKKDPNYLSVEYPCTYYVSCLTSRCYGHGNSRVRFPSKMAAIKAWNKRKGGCVLT